MESDVTQSAFFLQAWAWAEKHRKELIGGAIALAVVGLITGFYYWRQNEKEASANLALSQALATAPATPDAVPTALLKVASEHADTSASARAQLLAAGILFTQGRFADSQAQFEKYVREYGDSLLIGQALLGVAASLDAQGKTNEAVIAYKTVVDRRPADSVAPQARFALARLYENQGRLVEARDTFEAVYKSNPNTSLGSEAGIRHEELIARHPELAPPRPAPTPTPSRTVPGLPPAVNAPATNAPNR